MDELDLITCVLLEDNETKWARSTRKFEKALSDGEPDTAMAVVLAVKKRCTWITEAQTAELDVLHDRASAALRQRLQELETQVSMQTGGSSSSEQPTDVGSWAFQKRLIEAARKLGDSNAAMGYALLVYCQLSDTYDEDDNDDFWTVFSEVSSENNRVIIENNRPGRRTEWFNWHFRGIPPGTSIYSEDASVKAGPVGFKRTWAFQKELIQKARDDGKVYEAREHVNYALQSMSTIRASSDVDELLDIKALVEVEVKQAQSKASIFGRIKSKFC
ncbi:hypothetical protein ISF_08702 [Cordyceps fumosorosea ARSEF 2679]|uniref:Uncharacterized protein n=1 Tax=Cordyceps fumosorosea (strain ARSEF 2679) TaxID=1081104 RepID=A0A167LUX9_CORFA|nr:hypothetical protein ISF_08702 [Cordyceps fumosorosea ARSEF 2679]OAA53541.1 hypothetical protein ISF_08702 [Cordyceps fumosorosea ARSEF 2679]